MVVLFENAAGHPLAAGVNFGTHITMLTELDQESKSPVEMAARSLAHEVAHYYWRGGPTWLSEGAAEFTAAFSQRALDGRPLVMENYPCHRGRRHPGAGIAGWRRRGGFSLRLCPGGTAVFRICTGSWERRASGGVSAGCTGQWRLPGGRGEQRDGEPGIAAVRAAFAAGAATAGERLAVARATTRWYEGEQGFAISDPDTSPVVAELPSVNGWIDRAYVAFGQRGAPVDSFSAAAVAAGSREPFLLTLEYSYDFKGSRQLLDFEVREYYEDGLLYRRLDFSLAAGEQYAGGTQWVEVGPGAGQRWAPGGHRIYVYHEGRKVAEVGFEVSP